MKWTGIVWVFRGIAYLAYCVLSAEAGNTLRITGYIPLWYLMLWIGTALLVFVLYFYL